MARFAVILVVALVLPVRADSPPDLTIPGTTQRALSKVRLGMSDRDVMALMLPISIDYGRVYYGGTGHSRLYFQLSGKQQVWLEVRGFPDFAITEIGDLEPKTKWTRYDGDSITVDGM